MCSAPARSTPFRLMSASAEKYLKQGRAVRCGAYDPGVGTKRSRLGESLLVINSLKLGQVAQSAVQGIDKQGKRNALISFSFKPRDETRAIHVAL